MMDHITEKQKPVRGNANKAILAVPKIAKQKLTMAEPANMINTFLLSINFKSINPSRHPKVSNPQKYDTVFAPVVWGSNP